MNALVLTEEMAAGLEAINSQEGSNRKVQARRLSDGRLILNADLLVDETAAPWRAILVQASAVALTDADRCAEETVEFIGKS